MKHLDIYGVQYEFKFFGYDQYNSLFSFVLSMLTMASIIVMTFTFGADLYLKQNPKIMTQFAIPDPERDNFDNSQNFTIAWSIVDEKGFPTTLDNFLYPHFIYMVDGVEVKQAPVKCNTLNNIDPFFVSLINKVNEKEEDWHCLDLTSEQFNIIKLWKNQNPFEFRIYYCPDGDLNSPSCTPYSKLYDELVIKTKRLNLMVPEHMFDSSFQELPLQVGYARYTRAIDLAIIKKQDIFFRRVNMDTDFGWLWESWRKLSYITKTSYMTDIWKSFSKDLYLIEPSLFIVDFYFDTKFDGYSMSYLKLMDLAANVGGFLGIIMFFFQLFSNFYNGHFMKLTMYDKLFDFSFHKSKKDKSINNKLENIVMKDASKNDIASEYSKSNLTNRVMNVKNNVKNEVNENGQQGPQSDYEQQNIEMSNHTPTNPNLEKNLNLYGDKAKQITKDNMAQFLQMKKDNYTSLTELLNNTDEEKKLLLDKNLEIAGKFEDKLTDFGCYANLFMEFEYIKSLLLNPNQIKALRLVKLSINNTDRVFMENFSFNPVEDNLDELTQSEIMNYFITKINTNNLNNADRLILKLLDVEYKNLIEERIVNKDNFRFLMDNTFEN